MYGKSAERCRRNTLCMSMFHRSLSHSPGRCYPNLQWHRIVRCIGFLSSRRLSPLDVYRARPNIHSTSLLLLLFDVVNGQKIESFDLIQHIEKSQHYLFAALHFKWFNACNNISQHGQASCERIRRG